jgi:nicotinamidase-related amidase
VPIDLSALLVPAHSALLLMECQEGVIGTGAHLGQLAEAVARHGTVGQIARVLSAARRVRVPVFHCLMAQRPDRAGSAANCRLLAVGASATLLARPRAGAGGAARTTKASGW